MQQTKNFIYIIKVHKQKMNKVGFQSAGLLLLLRALHLSRHSLPSGAKKNVLSLKMFNIQLFVKRVLLSLLFFFF